MLVSVVPTFPHPHTAGFDVTISAISSHPIFLASSMLSSTLKAVFPAFFLTAHLSPELKRSSGVQSGNLSSGSFLCFGYLLKS